MINQLPTRSAERPPVAPVGSRVTICIAASFVQDEYLHGMRVDYCGVHFTVKQYTWIDKKAGLLRCDLDATILSHDGRMSYEVELTERKAQLRIHEQNIVEVLE